MNIDFMGPHAPGQHATPEPPVQAAQEPLQPLAVLGQGGGAPATGNAAVPARWASLPAELRARPQWCVAGPDKSPRTVSGARASTKDPSTWADFETASLAAARSGLHIGFVLTAEDPFACIDLDVKDNTEPEQLARFDSIVRAFDSFTEQSVSGRGWHIWVSGNIGKGRRRDGVEVYSQERFIVSTGDVRINRPIANRQEMLTNMVAQMSLDPAPELQVWGENGADWVVAQRAAEDTGELGRLFAGDWNRRYPSQSEADLALVKMLLPQTDSPGECWATFRLSKLGEREKAKRPDYAQSTLAKAAQHLQSDASQVQHGREVAANLLGDRKSVV